MLRRKQEPDPRAEAIAEALDAKLADRKRLGRAAATGYPGGRTLNRGLYKHLPSILGPESLWKQGAGKQPIAKMGYVVLTDSRLIFLATAIAGMGSRGVESIPISRILSVDTTRGLGQGPLGVVGAPLAINTGGGEIKVRVAPTAVADRMAAYVRAQIQAPAADSSPSGSAFAAQLRELAELRDAGIISNEEFESKKAEILGRI